MKSTMTRSGFLRLNDLHPLAPVGGLVDLVPLLRERSGDEGAHVGVVVDHQDRLRAGVRAWARGLVGGDRSLGDRPVGLAEQEPDRSALAGRAFDPRLAARLARHAVDHRQAEPGALADLLGGEEGLERALEHFGWHSDGCVVSTAAPSPVRIFRPTSRPFRSAAITTQIVKGPRQPVEFPDHQHVTGGAAFQ